VVAMGLLSSCGGPAGPAAVASIPVAIHALDCTGTRWCVSAGGSTADGARLYATRAGEASWRSMPSGAIALPSYVSAVSCSSPSRCVGVGEQPGPDSHLSTTLVETWDGSRWRAAPPSHGRGSSFNGLLSVSCPASWCVAVGIAYAGGLIESGDRGVWTVVANPDSGGGNENGVGSLSGVSCVSTSWCVAVGQGVGSKPVGMVVERWDGRQWSLVAIRAPRTSPASHTTTLSGVFCASRTWCVAVGQAGESPLIEAWDGSNWTQVVLPAASARLFAAFNSVSCDGIDDCVAVGWYNASGGPAPLAEYWDGRTWARVATPFAAGHAQGMMYTVTCSSKVSCLAGGEWFGVNPTTDNSVGASPLLERWSGGSWSIISPPR